MAARRGILRPVRPATTAIAAACLLVAASCSGESALSLPAAPLTYDAGGITFDYPANWEVLDGITAAEGTLGSGPVVGWLDAAGNLIGLTIQTERVDPPVPPGEERGYLTAAFSRHAGEVWGGGVVRDDGGGFVDAGLDGRTALRAAIDHAARGEPLTTTVLAAVEGATIVTVQCQAPTAVFDLVEPRCADVVGSLRVTWSSEDSASGGS
jgi:hypothetical protein